MRDIQDIIDDIEELTTTTLVGKGLPRPMGTVKKTRKKQESKLSSQETARFTKHGRRDKKSEEAGRRYAAAMDYYGHEIAMQSGEPCLCSACAGLDESKKGDRLRSFFTEPKSKDPKKRTKKQKEQPAPGRLQGGTAEIHKKGKQYVVVTDRWGYPTVLYSGTRIGAYKYANKNKIEISRVVENQQLDRGLDHWIHGVGSSKRGGLYRDKKSATKGKDEPSRQPPTTWPRQWTSGEKKTNPAYNKTESQKTSDLDTGSAGKNFENILLKAFDLVGLKYTKNKASGAMWDYTAVGPKWKKILTGKEINIKVAGARWLFGDASLSRALPWDEIKDLDKFDPSAAAAKVRRIILKKGIARLVFLKPKTKEVQTAITKAVNNEDVVLLNKLLIKDNFQISSLGRGFTVRVSVKDGRIGSIAVDQGGRVFMRSERPRKMGGTNMVAFKAPRDALKRIPVGSVKEPEKSSVPAT